MNLRRLWGIFTKYKDDRFFNEVFEREIYSPVLERGDNLTVIDLGAFHGEFDFYIYDKAKIIYAIEPQQEAYRQLVENCIDLPKISTHRLIISNLDGYKYINGGDGGGATTTDEGIESETKKKVESQTLATFMKNNGIEQVDILKIDVESHEPYIFASPDFKEVAHKVKFIIGEHGSGLREILEPLGFNYEEGFTAWRT